jgi:Ni/Co efflux regulator RcnB
MKTVLTAAAVATLSLAPNLSAQADNSNEIEASYETRQRETRHQREDRLRETHRRANRSQRETRHEREERLREAGRNPGTWPWQDPV